MNIESEFEPTVPLWSPKASLFNMKIKLLHLLKRSVHLPLGICTWDLLFLTHFRTNCCPYPWGVMEESTEKDHMHILGYITIFLCSTFSFLGTLWTVIPLQKYFSMLHKVPCCSVFSHSNKTISNISFSLPCSYLGTQGAMGLAGMWEQKGRSFMLPHALCFHTPQNPTVEDFVSAEIKFDRFLVTQQDLDAWFSQLLIGLLSHESSWPP